MAVSTRATTLVSFMRAKEYLGTQKNAADEDIATMADAASEYIEQFTGVTFVTRSVTEIHDGDGSRELALRAWPTTAITSIDIVRTLGGAPETIAVADRTVDLVLGRICLHASAFTRGFQNVTVVHSPGYGPQDSATLPEDIVSACLDIFKLRWDERRSHGIAATSIAVGSSSYVLKPDWPAHIRDTLEQWRRFVVA